MGHKSTPPADLSESYLARKHTTGRHSDARLTIIVFWLRTIVCCNKGRFHHPLESRQRLHQRPVERLVSHSSRACAPSIDRISIVYQPANQPFSLIPPTSDGRLRSGWKDMKLCEQKCQHSFDSPRLSTRMTADKSSEGFALDASHTHWLDVGGLFFQSHLRLHSREDVMRNWFLQRGKTNRTNGVGIPCLVRATQMEKLFFSIEFNCKWHTTSKAPSESACNVRSNESIDGLKSFKVVHFTLLSDGSRSDFFSSILQNKWYIVAASRSRTRWDNEHVNAITLTRTICCSIANCFIFFKHKSKIEPIV